MPCVDGLDVFARDGAADDLVDELVAAALLVGLELDDRVAVLALAAGLADVAAVALRRAADRLAIRHLRLADVGRDLELAHHAVDEHVEVQLAHAGDERLAGLLVGVDAEGRVLLGQALEGDRRACPGRPWSWARWPTSMTGSGKVIDSSTTGWSGSHSVSPVKVSLRPTAAAMSPA